MYTRLALLGLSLLLLLSCNKGGSSSSKEQSAQTTTASTVQAFPYPQIPATLTDPAERLAYMLNHYWDGYDFSDTLLMQNRDVTEQGFVNFVALLADPNATPQHREQAMQHYSKGVASSPKALQQMGDLTERYLYTPTSPLHNEELYTLYLQQLLLQLPADEPHRSTMEYTLTLMGRNNVGDEASNFNYITPNGTNGTLHATKVKGKRLLIFFYDPDCESCHHYMDLMHDDNQLKEWVKQGKLTVLAVNTQHPDERWPKAQERMPQGWVHVCDQMQVTEQGLYDLKGMPTFILTDPHYKVVLKDPTYEELMLALNSTLQ